MNTHTSQTKPDQDYQHILLATDFSPASKQAAIRAQHLAEKHAARLTFLHVFEELIIYSEFFEPTLTDLTTLDNERKKHATEQLQKLADASGQHDVVIEVQQGHPKQIIQEFSREHDVDLIVLGSHGGSGITRLLGSTANRVLHDAPCDVLIVKNSETE